jgi:hypothetical protein
MLAPPKSRWVCCNVRVKLMLPRISRRARYAVPGRTYVDEREKRPAGVGSEGPAAQKLPALA